MSYEKNKTKLFNQYPAVVDLEKRAKQRIPHVAWEYLQAGTGRESLAKKNLEAFDKITFQPQFCKGELVPNIQTNILGQAFNAPFGMAPVGLTGLMWPKAEIILAKTANKYQIPFTLSTVATETPEKVGPHVGNMGWFQLYPPRRKELRKALLERAKNAGFHTLVVTADVPTPSRRERTKRAGLSTPPKITPSFIWQGITHPRWTALTLMNGLPKLRTVAPYANGKTMKSAGDFVRAELGGTLSWEYCKQLREEWDGPIVIKGILHPKDAESAIRVGMDGIVVSNHGGRQFDGGPTAIEVLPEIVQVAKTKIAILFDSGVRTGLDMMRALSLGAEFVLLGRAFMYGVSALGNYGADHVTEILMEDLKNNMVQAGLATLEEVRK